MLKPQAIYKDFSGDLIQGVIFDICRAYKKAVHEKNESTSKTKSDYVGISNMYFCFFNRGLNYLQKTQARSYIL